MANNLVGDSGTAIRNETNYPVGVAYEFETAQVCNNIYYGGGVYRLMEKHQKPGN